MTLINTGEAFELTETILITVARAHFKVCTKVT